jgi:hypothetical protein
MFSHHGQRVSKAETIVPGVNTLDSGTTSHCISVGHAAPLTERGVRGRRPLEDGRGSFRRHDVSVSARKPPIGIGEAVAADRVGRSIIDGRISNLGITPAGEVRTRRLETTAEPQRPRRLDRPGRSVRSFLDHAVRRMVGIGRSKPLLRTITDDAHARSKAEGAQRSAVWCSLGSSVRLP